MVEEQSSNLCVRARQRSRTQPRYPPHIEGDDRGLLRVAPTGLTSSELSSNLMGFPPVPETCTLPKRWVSMALAAATRSRPACEHPNQYHIAIHTQDKGRLTTVSTPPNFVIANSNKAA